MAEIGSAGNAMHPVGWSFLGAGAAVLWPGASLLLGWDVAAPLSWGTSTLVWLVFAVSVFGAFFDFLLHQTLERGLLKVTGLMAKNPPSEAWSAMWRTRWRSGQSDQEMRRHEGMVSLARAYLVYFLVGGLLLAFAPVPVLHRILWPIFGILAASFCGYMWYWHTNLIFVIVKSAKKWETDQS